MAVGVVSIALNASLGRTPFVVLAAIEIAAFAGALWLFHRNGRLAPLVTTFAFVGMGLLFLSLIPAGGLAWGAMNLVWIILVPIAAVLFLGPRAGPIALGGVILVVVAALVLDPIIGSEPPVPTTARLIQYAIDIIVTAAVALALVVFIDGERLRAKAESDALLLNVLPAPIADRLKGGERVIADHYDEVTILFADIVDFTPFAARESPARVVAVLNEVFSGFDALAERHGLEKIKTIGDAYMVIAGAPEPRADHASVIVDMALEMLAVAGRVEAAPGTPIRLRIGVASGPAVAGVIGQRKFSYDVWSDAVNLASRLEATGVPGSIQVAASTWRLCAERYAFTERDVEVKGIGMVHTYLLDPGAMQRQAL
jgi:class 3 adenylate cyclase